jgi:hypothetical protein
VQIWDPADASLLQNFGCKIMHQPKLGHFPPQSHNSGMPSASNHPEICRHLDTYKYYVHKKFDRFITRFAPEKSICVKEVSCVEEVSYTVWVL